MLRFNLHFVKKTVASIAFFSFVIAFQPFCNCVDLAEDIAHISPSDVFIGETK